MQLRTHHARAGALLALAAMLAAGSVPATAAQKPFPDGAPPGGGSHNARAEAKAAAEPAFQDWAKVTKDATRKEGFFNTWTRREDYYWEIQKSQLEKPFLLNAHFTRGVGADFMLGGLPIADGMMQFERRGDRIFLVRPNVRMIATGPDSAYRRAVDLSFGNSVLQSFKIASEKDSTVLINMADLFVSDALDLSTRLRATMDKPFRFDKDRSAVTEHKTFPKNIEVEATLTYSPGDREGLSLDTVPDTRFVPLTVHYSFLELPEEPYVPRLADDRVGYFLDAYKDMSRDYNDDYWVRYINRWKLEKKDPAAPVSDVKQPIVFYLENTIPEEWKPYVRAGIEEWQKAYEAAGLRNAIIARDQPADDPDWDAEDARYSTIRWITSSEPSFGAIGPSETDPRTGQILNADILIEGSMIVGYSNMWRRWVDTRTVEEAMGTAWADADKLGLDPTRLCMAGLGQAQEGAFLGIAMQLEGLTPPGQPVPKEFVGSAIKAVTMHEVGHTLGLRHNFKSSTSVPRDKLQDRDYVAKNGLEGSIMDYDTANIAAPGEKQGYYWTPTIGPYDIWAIRYGYTPTGASNPADDKRLIEPIAREATQPGNAYGTDEDTYPADALDPDCNIFDLGANPLAFSKQRTEYVATLWQEPGIEDKLMQDNDSYVTLRRAMDNMLIQYARGLGHARKYIGGQYANRFHKGDPGATGPFQPVPPDEQREAMAFIADRAFSPRAFDVPAALLNKVGRDQWSDWGNNLFAYGRNDYPFLSRVEQVQTGMLNGLLNPALLARLREQEARVPKPFRVADLFAGLTGSIMSELGLGGRPLQLAALDGPGPRRTLQRNYVDRLADMVATPASPAPDDAQALARLHLTRIADACRSALASPQPKSDTLRAHLLELQARARRALEVQRQLPTSRPTPAFASPTATAGG